MIFVAMQKGKLMSDLISTQESVTKIVDTAIRKILSGEQKLTKEYEQSVKDAVNVILDTARREAQAEIVRCRDCKYWREGTVYLYCDKLFGMGILDAYDYMTDEDDFCSMAERRTDG